MKDGIGSCFVETVVPELWRDKRLDRPLVLGHRGASAKAPENTMLAFHRAIADGADGFELDVRLTSCGTLVVYHDDSLERFWQDARLVSSISWLELSELKIDGESVPRLLDVLLEFPDCLVNVELKKHPLPMVLALVRETITAIQQSQSSSRVLVSSFDPRLLWVLKKTNASIARALLYSKEQTLPLRQAWLANILQVSALHPEHFLVNQKVVQKIHRQNRFVNTWTVNQAEQIRSLARNNVDGLISNDPGLTLSILEE